MDVKAVLIELERAYKSGYLISYIRGLDSSTIIQLRNLIIHDLMINYRDTLDKALEDELEFRCLNTYISSKDSSFLADKYDLKMNDAAEFEVRNSTEILMSLDIPLTIIKWVPAFLYMDKAFAVYSYLRTMNKTEDEINKVFLASFDTFMKIAERTKLKDEYDQYYNEFVNYVVYLSQLVTSRKSVTESYQKYTMDVLNKNQELLRRLS